MKIMIYKNTLYCLKSSNPKISRMPIAAKHSGGSISSLIDLTSQLNNCPYLNILNKKMKKEKRSERRGKLKGEDNKLKS